MAKSQKTWLPGRPKRSTVGMTWLPARPRRSATAISPTFKAEVEKKASELVEAVLKPRYVKPKPKKPRFNYIIDVSIKWLGSKLFFIATYACPGPTAISPTFESRFARMELVGQKHFTLSFMRHNDKWVRLHHGLSLDDCLETIRDDYWFQLG